MPDATRNFFIRLSRKRSWILNNNRSAVRVVGPRYAMTLVTNEANGIIDYFAASLVNLENNK